MSSSAGPSIYFAHDKSVHDALRNQRVTAKVLSGFLRSRGILVSPKESREALIKQITRTFIDYHDLNEIFSWIDQVSRKERKEVNEVEVTLNAQEVIAACTSLQDEVEPGESVSVKTSGNSIYVEVNYSDVDYSKAELRQRVPKKCVIEVEQTTSGLKIRKPQNDKASDYEDRILRKLSEKMEIDEPLKRKVISLSGVKDSTLRSKFFISLAEGIRDFNPEIISAVKTNRSKPEKFEDDEVDDGVDIELAGYINDAALNGVDVLKSSQFANLAAEGFYITKMIWSVTSTVPDGEKIEIEAAFSDSDKCSGFSYRIRSVFSKKKGALEFNSTGRPPSQTEEKDYSKRIEESAKLAVAAVVAEAGGIDNE